MIKPILQEPYEIEVFTNFVKSIRNIDGDLAEVGVYMGGTAQIMRECSDKPLWLFDTFEGLPDCLTPEDIKHNQYVGGCAAGDEYIKQLKLENVNIIKGVFPKTSGVIKDKKFSFVHIDTDIYKSTIDSLEFFFTRMSSGGIIIIHDYPHHPGVKKATDEYLQDKKVELTQSGVRQLIIKC